MRVCEYIIQSEHSKQLQLNTDCGHQECGVDGVEDEAVHSTRMELSDGHQEHDGGDQTGHNGGVQDADHLGIGQLQRHIL